MLSSRDRKLEDLFQQAEFSGAEIFEGPDIRGRNPILDVYYDYWHSKRPTDGLPRRDDIRPEELGSYLPYATLFDVLDEPSIYQDFRLVIRLVGTHVAEAFGEIAGKDAAEIPNQATAKRVYYMAALACAKHAPVMSRVRGYAPGREHMEAFALYSPLSDSGETIDKILAAAEVRLAEDSR